MYVVVKEHLRHLDGWKWFAEENKLDLSKPFLVERDYDEYAYKGFRLHKSTVTPFDKPLEDYL